MQHLPVTRSRYSGTKNSKARHRSTCNPNNNKNTWPRTLWHLIRSRHSDAWAQTNMDPY